MLDGDTPLSHGRLRVYEMGSRSALLQSNGKAQERAYCSGVALLEFARLPSDFTVEVSDARPGGRPLRGTFRAAVHDYRAGGVVHVDPVTTLVARTKQPSGLGPKTIPGLPYGNWLLPSRAAFEQLVDGWSGANPAEWLQLQAHISERLLKAKAGQMWTGDDFQFFQGTFPRLEYGVFDLRRGERSPRGGFSWFFADGWKGDFDAARAGRLFHRDLNGGETYWWGG